MGSADGGGPYLLPCKRSGKWRDADWSHERFKFLCLHIHTYELYINIYIPEEHAVFPKANDTSRRDMSFSLTKTGSNGIPSNRWYPMVYHRIQWYTIGSNGIPLYPMVYYRIQWYTIGSNGIPSDPMVYHRIRWLRVHILAYGPHMISPSHGVHHPISLVARGDGGLVVADRCNHLVFSLAPGAQKQRTYGHPYGYPYVYTYGYPCGYTHGYP